MGGSSIPITTQDGRVDLPLVKPTDSAGGGTPGISTLTGVQRDVSFCFSAGSIHPDSQESIVDSLKSQAGHDVPGRVD